jgi:RNA recognition motif-containing protein
MARKLYVGNFPYDTTDQDLRALFADSGEIDSALSRPRPDLALRR